MKSIRWIVLTTLTAALAACPLRALAQDTDPFQGIRTYDYQARKPVAAIYDMIRAAQADPAQIATIEQKLDAVLEDPQATVAGKQEVCRMLWIIGSAKSVPALSKMLADDKLSNQAVYGLERNPSPEAGHALRAALDTTTGKMQSGIADALGARRDASAVPALARLMTSGDSDVARSAVNALGSIGGDRALAALRAHRPQDLLTDEAIQRCADGMVATQPAKAASAFAAMLKETDLPPSARMGAAWGLLESRPAGAPAQILQFLKGDDTDLSAVGVRFLRTLPATASITPLTGSIDILSPASQVLLIEALSDRGTDDARAALVKEASSPDASVRTAALSGLGGVQGDAATVALLAGVAANNAEAAGVRDAARQGLAHIKGVAGDQAIVTAIGTAADPVKVELINSLRQRNAKGATPILMAQAASPTADVQNAALAALGDLAAPADYPALVTILVGAKTDDQRASAASAVQNAARRLENVGDRTAPLIAGLNGAPVPTQVTILNLVGSMGGADGLNAIRTALKSDIPDIKDAAVRALAGSSDPGVMNDLLDIARNGDTKVHQVIALRGYLHLVAQTVGHNGPPEKALQDYQQALPLASETQDKRTVLAGLGKTHLPDALKVMEPMLNDTSVTNEVSLGIIEVAKAAGARSPDESRTALNKVVVTCKDDGIVKQANDVLATLK